MSATGGMEAALRELAALRSERDPIVSLYLDTRWSDEHQRERVRLFVRDRSRELLDGYSDGPFRAELGRTLAEVSRYVEELCRREVDEGAHGVAVFACSGLGVWRRYVLPRPFRPQLAAAEVAHLLPLAKQAEELLPVIVAHLSTRDARIRELAVGGVVIEEALHREAHRRHHMGGWSQRRYARHITDQIRRNLREAAAHVVFLFDETPRARIVLVGVERDIVQFEALLPERVAQRIIARLPNPQAREEAAAADELVRKVQERLEVMERDEEEERVGRLAGEARAGGNAVIGVAAVVEAANERQIHELFMGEDFGLAGWRCLACDALGVTGASTCTYCGGEVLLLPLREELIRRVLGADGHVEVVRAGLLVPHGGVGALLRHRESAAGRQGAPAGRSEPETFEDAGFAPGPRGVDSRSPSE